MIHLFWLAFFAFFVTAITLMRLLRDVESPSLKGLKRLFGRKLGLAIHFVAHAALPMLVGIVFTCEAIVTFSPQAIQVTQSGVYGAIHQVLLDASRRHHQTLLLADKMSVRAAVEAGFLVSDRYYPILCP